VDHDGGKERAVGSASDPFDISSSLQVGDHNDLIAGTSTVSRSKDTSLHPSITNDNTTTTAWSATTTITKFQESGERGRRLKSEDLLEFGDSGSSNLQDLSVSQRHPLSVDHRSTYRTPHDNLETSS
jgi:hypothetical protein